MESVNQISEECLAARKQCVLFDHPNRGVIEVRGADHIQFLHNVLSNDIKSLSPGKGIPACLLNAQAKIVANPNVLCFKNFLWLALDYVLKDKLIDALAKLIIMEQVELIDRSDELKLISVHGPKAKELVTTVFAQQPSHDLLHHIRIVRPAGQLSEVFIEIIRINLIGEEGYGILFPKSETENLKSVIKQHVPSNEVQATTMDIMRIESGIPKYGVDYDESNIPLECRLDKTVSFSKGCFPGQEILARLDSRGGISKKLMGLELEGKTVPKKGDLITKDGNEAGHITSSAFSPFLKKIIAMGYLKKECWAAGTLVVIETEGAHISGQVVSLPFYFDRTTR